MSRVLVTGGAGMIGQAIVRQLVRDPDFEVRVSDERLAEFIVVLRRVIAEAQRRLP